MYACLAGGAARAWDGCYVSQDGLFHVVVMDWLQCTVGTWKLHQCAGPPLDDQVKITPLCLLPLMWVDNWRSAVACEIGRSN